MIHEALSTQDKLISYGPIQTNKRLLYGGDINHLFSYYPSLYIFGMIFALMSHSFQSP